MSYEKLVRAAGKMEAVGITILADTYEVVVLDSHPSRSTSQRVCPCCDEEGLDKLYKDLLHAYAERVAKAKRKQTDGGNDDAWLADLAGHAPLQKQKK